MELPLLSDHHTNLDSIAVSLFPNSIRQQGPKKCNHRWRSFAFLNIYKRFCTLNIVWLTLSRVGGGRSAPPVTYLRIHDCIYIYTRQFFLTIPHFECGRGDSTFHSIKLHRFPRKIKSWSILLYFHKGGPLRTS